LLYISLLREEVRVCDGTGASKFDASFELMQNPNRNGQLRFSDLLVLFAVAGTIVGGLLTL
jgi:hypothetical protein